MPGAKHICSPPMLASPGTPSVGSRAISAGNSFARRQLFSAAAAAFVTVRKVNIFRVARSSLGKGHRARSAESLALTETDGRSAVRLRPRLKSVDHGLRDIARKQSPVEEGLEHRASRLMDAAVRQEI